VAPQLVVIRFLYHHPGEGRDPFIGASRVRGFAPALQRTRMGSALTPRWAPAFAGVVEKGSCKLALLTVIPGTERSAGARNP